MTKTKALALSGIICPVWFTTWVVVQGLLQPDYSHVRMPISALAAWPTGWIQNVNFYVTGTLAMAFAFTLRHAVRPTRWGQTGSALLLVGGFGVILAGVFPWRMVNDVPTETPAHVVGAITAFFATGLGLIVFSRGMSADSRWRTLAPYTMYSGIAVLVLFITVGFFAVDDSAPLHAWAGLIQRILCTVWFTCMIVLAFRVRTN